MSEHLERKSHVREVVVHETRELIAISAFLAAFFVSLTTYRRLLLKQYDIDYYEYGYALIESIMMAKIILLGEAFHLGEHFRDRSLAISTLWKTAVFSIVVALFTVLEHFVGALVHGRPLASALPQLSGPGLYEMLARIVVALVAFIPLFAVRELGRVFGEGKLFELFFRRGRQSQPS